MCLDLGSPPRIQVARVIHTSPRVDTPHSLTHTQRTAFPQQTHMPRALPQMAHLDAFFACSYVRLQPVAATAATDDGRARPNEVDSPTTTTTTPVVMDRQMEKKKGHMD